MNSTHTLMDPEAQSLFCASPSYTWRTQAEPRRQHHQNLNSPWAKSNNAKPNPTNELRTSFASAARTKWTRVWQYSPRSRVSGRTVTVAMTVLCYYQRERERDWSCGIRARCSGGESERASADWSLCGWWEWLGGGRGYLPLAAGVADDFEWDKSDGDIVSARCV